MKKFMFITLVTIASTFAMEGKCPLTDPAPRVLKRARTDENINPGKEPRVPIDKMTPPKDGFSKITLAFGKKIDADKMVTRFTDVYIFNDNTFFSYEERMEIAALAPIAKLKIMGRLYDSIDISSVMNLKPADIDFLSTYFGTVRTLSINNSFYAALEPKSDDVIAYFCKRFRDLKHLQIKNCNYTTCIDVHGVEVIFSRD